MSTLAEVKPGSSLTPTDLAELMASFNEVTARLERTHESLRLEVSRLQGELREANEQLQRSRRLAALGEMAAGIAHEVRNPLGSIRLYARMLEQDLGDRPAERTLAGKIAGAVSGLDAIVGDVLSFARETRVCFEEVDPRELIDRAISACAPPSSVRVAIRSGRAHLRCDALLMHQALVNLVRNAVQAMEEAPPPAAGHTLALEAGRRSGECFVKVGDTGPGVPPDVVDRMFNPFFTTRKTGTGLGLAIVHRIVDAHGGRITVGGGGKRGKGGAEGGAIFELAWPPGTDEETTLASARRDGAAPGGAFVQESSR